MSLSGNETGLSKNKTPELLEGTPAADQRSAVAGAIAMIDLFRGNEDGALTPHVTGRATETVGPMGAGTVIVTADDDPVRTAIRTRGRFSRGVRCPLPDSQPGI